MGTTITQADILDWAASYDGPLFHAALLDAPYEMEFMGKGWDNSGIAFNPETWKAIARHLHPGAFLFVFAGTINDDLISVAMRQAGLRKYHRGAAWIYGSGFPKAAKLDTVIDRRAGVERTKVGTKKHQPKFDAKGFEYRKKDNGFNSKDRETFDVTAPATELAQAWAGHRYGGQMLKPAMESILIFQKLYEGDPVSSITTTGAGALNIAGGRVGTKDGDYNHPGNSGIEDRRSVYGVFANGNQQPPHPAGRWPANLVLSHHPACEPRGMRRVKGSHKPGGGEYPAPNGYEGGWADRLPAQHYADPDGRETVAAWDCHPDCAVLALGRQSGESISTGGKTNTGLRGLVYSGGYSGEKLGEHSGGLGDTGTAARFFFNSDYLLDRLEDADAVRYEAKASRSEREAGLDPRQVRLLGMMEVERQDTSAIYGNETVEGAAARGRRPRHSNQPIVYGQKNTITRCPEHDASGNGNVYRCGCPVVYGFPESTINDGRAKSIDNPYQRGETTRRNVHPTIKPISLARHLATLLLPPAEYAPRRLLIPFAGAGSEMIGALLAGWEEVVGVELEEEHCRIATARLAYWQQRRHEFGDPSKPITATLSDAPDGQLELF